MQGPNKGQTCVVQSKPPACDYTNRRTQCFYHRHLQVAPCLRTQPQGQVDAGHADTNSTGQASKAGQQPPWFNRSRPLLAPPPAAAASVQTNPCCTALLSAAQHSQRQSYKALQHSAIVCSIVRTTNHHRQSAQTAVTRGSPCTTQEKEVQDEPSMHCTWHDPTTSAHDSRTSGASFSLVALQARQPLQVATAAADANAPQSLHPVRPAQLLLL